MSANVITPNSPLRYEQVGQGALPREPEQSEKDRGTEQSELMTFTDLGKKVNRRCQKKKWSSKTNRCQPGSMYRAELDDCMCACHVTFVRAGVSFLGFPWFSFFSLGIFVSDRR